MEKGTTWILKVVIVLMGIVALAVCIFALPSINSGAAADYPGADGWLRIFTGALYLSVIPFFIALYQGMKLLNHIEKNTAFSPVSVRALQAIKLCGIAISVCYVGTLPFFYHVADVDDAPGLALIALAFVCVPLVVTTFAAVLEKLFRNAIELKSENDLTV
jgi:hypothetical protein